MSLDIDYTIYPYLNYHSEEACGPRADSLYDEYHSRLFCKRGEDVENKEKFEKAKRCFAGRVAKSRSEGTPLISHTTSIDSIRSNIKHMNPIGLAYKFAEDCVGKLHGNVAAFKDNALRFAPAQLRETIEHASIIPKGSKAKVKCKHLDCPELISINTHIKDFRPLSEDLIFQIIRDFPFYSTASQNELRVRIRSLIMSIDDAYDRGIKKQVRTKLEKLRSQLITIQRLITTPANLSTESQSNRKKFNENKNTDMIANTRRANTNYYKHAREKSNLYSKTRKNARNNVISHI